MSEIPPIVDTVVGTGYLQNDSVWVDGRDVRGILCKYNGLNVKLLLSHKPDASSTPSFLWQISKTGLLTVEGEECCVNGVPLDLQPMVGHNSVVSIVNLDFQITPVDDFKPSETDLSEIAKREEKLRSVLGNLSDVLGTLVGEKQ